MSLVEFDAAVYPPAHEAWAPARLVPLDYFETCRRTRSRRGAFSFGFVVR